MKLRINNGSKRLLVISILTFGVVLLTGNLFGVNTSRITDLLGLFFFFINDVNGIIVLLCFLIPLNTGITKLYIFFFAVLFIIFKEKKVKFNILILFVSISLYEYIMSFTVNGFDIKYYFTYISILFILIYILFKEDGINARACCYAFIAGSALLLLCVLLTAFQKYGVSQVLSGMVRIGVYGEAELLESATIISDNANNLGYYSSIAITLAILLIKKTDKKTKTLLMISIIINTVGGVFTLSRSWVLVSLIGLVLSVLFGYEVKSKIAISIGLFISLYLVYQVLLTQTNVMQAMIDRIFLSEGRQSFAENDRFKLINEYWDFLRNNPTRIWTGTGAMMYKEICRCSNSLHSGAQQILISYGIPGCIVFAYILFYPIISWFKTHKFKIHHIIPILTVVVFTQTIQFLNPYILMLPYAVGICYMRIIEN